MAIVAVVGGLAVLGLAVGTSVFEDTVMSPEAVRAEAMLRHAIEMRRSQGLRSDKAYVRSTFTLPVWPSMLVDIPLTAAEERFLEGQQSVAGAVARIEPTFKGEPGFGGAWFDFPSGRIVVAVTAAAAADLHSRFADAVGARNPVVVVKVDQSLEDLWATYTKANTLAASDANGALRSVSLRVDQNSVVLGVRPATSRAVRAQIVATVGPGTTFIDAEEVGTLQTHDN